ncbi:MAG: cobyric acid synthase [Spirochaetaceae bacterium]|jgi:adenosylcobyric acid synthase|nr:cobyric acid synthase [Spirochaetaceae bacterium]
MAVVMLQGTGSDVGKSVLVAGLCRVFANRGMRVRPFKPQNMSNNAAAAEFPQGCPPRMAGIEKAEAHKDARCFQRREFVADKPYKQNCQGRQFCGGEIGRAQALQALACRVKPSVDMNPVLLKPQTDTGAQVIVQGEVYGFLNAKDFNTKRTPLLGAVLESFERLRGGSEIVVVEGAGSPAETNLRSGDIANMGFARAAGVPVILVGDIDRGGVIASIVGTKAVLDAEDAAFVKGFIINKFRGNVTLFDGGYKTIEQATNWRGLGIVPWLNAARSLPAEDAVPGDLRSAGAVTIAVPVMPHIANFDDIDALEAESAVRVVRARPGQALPGDARLVILPGSKATISDLAFLRAQGWDIDLAAHIRRGGYVLGICGGYQMLGKTISDPLGIEGEPVTVEGLGLLPVHTKLDEEKRVSDVRGVSLPGHIPFRGYEIHCGRTEAPPDLPPLLELEDGSTDGIASADGHICGCYIHRLFDDPRQRSVWLEMLGASSDGIDQDMRVDAALDAIALALEGCLNIEGILEIANSA